MLSFYLDKGFGEWGQMVLTDQNSNFGDRTCAAEKVRLVTGDGQEIIISHSKEQGLDIQFPPRAETNEQPC